MMVDFEKEVRRLEARVALLEAELEGMDAKVTALESIESKELLELAELCATMRNHQKKARNTGRFNDLQVARRSEAVLDEKLSGILNPSERRLFN